MRLVAFARSSRPVRRRFSNSVASKRTMTSPLRKIVPSSAIQETFICEFALCGAATGVAFTAFSVPSAVTRRVKVIGSTLKVATSSQGPEQAATRSSESADGVPERRQTARARRQFFCPRGLIAAGSGMGEGALGPPHDFSSSSFSLVDQHAVAGVEPFEHFDELVVLAAEADRDRSTSQGAAAMDVRAGGRDEDRLPRDHHRVFTRPSSIVPWKRMPGRIFAGSVLSSLMSTRRIFTGSCVARLRCTVRAAW